MTNYLSVQQVEERLLSHQLLAEADQNQIIAQFLPTARWHVPGFACFRCPATVGSYDVSPPDRYWVFDANSGDVLIYARVEAQPFAADMAAHGITLPPPVQRSRAESLADQKVFSDLLDLAAPAFFAGAPADPAVRRDLVAIAPRILEEQMLPWFRALAPDFFEWLGA